ncbi:MULTISPECIES: cbb3-type cytochrome c oxidase N-terminal domain-containing protein [unclassified Paraflavitalea]|uniref:cbb3-type cytochrome c oxidase N-terminal domain-containing protein n=1 Tax=unclassified Paraflavitalea TaxID=2798305 RepID=UPI003D338D23
MLLNFLKHRYTKRSFLATVAAVIASPVWAAGPPAKQSISDPVVISLVLLSLLLLLVIGILANVLLGAAKYEVEEYKKKNVPKVAAVLAIGLLTSISSFAQDTKDAAAAAVADDGLIAGMDSTTFYLLMGVLALETLVIVFLLLQLKGVIKRIKYSSVVATESGEVVEAAGKKPGLSWWDKFNSFRPAEQEADIDLGHDYDGIRELDNRLPPWWLWGFYITIVAAGIYLYRYHVAHSAPLSAEELAIEMKAADARQAEYLKKAANNVDESNVKVLTASTDLDAGKTLFIQNCTVCHGKNAEGMVGPNLTDDYWIHSGSVSDIFKSIKYGWPDKGMKSWKDDLTPNQMAQLSSYILSLKGTNPANAKAPQGELYKDAPAIADSAAGAKDTALAPAVTK